MKWATPRPWPRRVKCFSRGKAVPAEWLIFSTYVETKKHRSATPATPFAKMGTSTISLMLYVNILANSPIYSPTYHWIYSWIAIFVIGCYICDSTIHGSFPYAPCMEGVSTFTTKINQFCRSIYYTWSILEWLTRTVYTFAFLDDLMHDVTYIIYISNHQFIIIIYYKWVYIYILYYINGNFIIILVIII